MDPPAKTQLICNKENHNEPVIFVSMDDNEKLTNKLHCPICLKTCSNIGLTPIDEAIELIRKNDKQNGSQIKMSLEKLLQETKQLQMTQSKIFEDSLQLIKEWIMQIENQQLEKQNSIIDEFQSYFQGQSIKNMFCFSFKKQMDAFDQLFSDFKEYWCNLFKEIISDRVNDNQIQQQSQLQDVSSIELVNSVEQEKWVGAMTFNQEGTILVTQSNINIQIWQFEKGKMTKLKKLKGHQDWINGLVYSKKLNWIASCSSDKSIRCWKEQPNNDWICNKPKLKHTDSVMCILLNQNEDELLSCSQDKTIKAWKVNCITNQIDFEYSLDTSDMVYSISLNESETCLVSYGADKKILLWIKQNRWVYQNQISNQDQVMGAYFIDNYFIACQQILKSFTHVFEVQNQCLKLQNYNRIGVDKDSENENNQIFQTLVNKEKQVIVQQHHKLIYIIQNQGQGKLRIMGKPIFCDSETNFGALTQDGQYLVIWNNETTEFKVYNIKYNGNKYE